MATAKIVREEEKGRDGGGKRKRATETLEKVCSGTNKVGRNYWPRRRRVSKREARFPWHLGG